MKKLMIASFVFALSISSSFAQETDLVLPGEKWVATFKNYICAAFGPDMAQPTDHSSMNVKFEKMTTDSTLDNGLIKATFVENGTVCRYNAIVLADNAAATMRLVTSKAYSTSGKSDCAEGKSVLDAGFESNNYLYFGHPHNLAIMVPMQGAEALCGAGNKFVGVTFVVSGRVK